MSDPLAQALTAIEAVRALHSPADAAMYGGRNVYKVQVCTGCGQDDGDWQRYPCPTVRAIAEIIQSEAPHGVD